MSRLLDIAKSSIVMLRKITRSSCLSFWRGCIEIGVCDFSSLYSFCFLLGGWWREFHNYLKMLWSRCEQYKKTQTALGTLEVGLEVIKRRNRTKLLVWVSWGSCDEAKRRKGGMEETTQKGNMVAILDVGWMNEDQNIIWTLEVMIIHDIKW